MVDKHPQWMNLTTATLNGTTIVVSETNAPNMGTNQVMEILKAQYDHAMPVLASAGAVSGDESNELQAIITQGSTPGTGNLVGLNDNRCIDRLHRKEESQFAETTETGGGPFASELITIHDFTDGKGNGFLVSSQVIFLQVQGSNATMIQEVRARLLYRIVKVSSEELIALTRQ